MKQDREHEERKRKRDVSLLGTSKRIEIGKGKIG